MLSVLKVDNLMRLLSKDIKSQLCPVYHIVNPESKEEEFQLTPTHKWTPKLTRVRDGKEYYSESSIRGILGTLEKKEYIVVSRMEELCHLKES